jgi:hypothetical protein
VSDEDGFAGDASPAFPLPGLAGPFGGLSTPDIGTQLAPDQLTPWQKPQPMPGRSDAVWAALRGTQALGGTFSTKGSGNMARAVDITLPVPEPITAYVIAESLALAPDATDAEFPWGITVGTGSGGSLLDLTYGLTSTGVVIPLRTARLTVDVTQEGGRDTQALTFRAVVGRGIATSRRVPGDSKIFAAAGTVDLRIPPFATALTVSVGPGGGALVHGLDLLGNDRFGQYPVAASTTQVFSIPRQVVDIQIEVGVAAVVWWGWEATA